MSKDDKTGEWTSFDACRLVFNEDQQHRAGGPRSYAEIHAHYKCDENGRPLLDARGQKQYLDRPVFDENGELKWVGKAIHLKHPSQASVGRNFESRTDESVHRWALQVSDFEMMLAYRGAA